MCRNFKWSQKIDFFNICDRKNFNLIYGGGWYMTSGLLLAIVKLML